MMTEKQSRGVIYLPQGNILKVLNQKALPHQEEWIDCRDVAHMVQMIRDLTTRGAPLIGIAACLAIGQSIAKGASASVLRQEMQFLIDSRPTAVNLSIYINRLRQALERSASNPQNLYHEIDAIYEEDLELCQKMAINGEQVIKKGERILTICNTGQLATAGIGTAFGVCAYSHKNGKNIHVYACETRPLLQGGRLTAWELGREGIPHTLICDSMAGFLMQQKKIDRILVGADRIARNGDFANKIGSYSLAVLAHYHQIPYHVVAPYTTIDPHCANGAEIEVEERNPDEVRGLKMGQKELLWAPASSPVYNPAFDVTPNELVTSYFLDKGIFTAENLAKAYT